MRLAPLAAVPVMLVGLACSGLLPGTEKEEAAAPSAAAPSAATPAKDSATGPAPASAPAPAPVTSPEDAKAAAKALVKAGYTANVYGVCKKYSDCKCNTYDSVQACVEQFGHAAEIFPQPVWACVLARDCEGLCGFDAGTCFDLYATQLKEGSKKPRDADKCAAGTVPVEVYNLHGEYVRTDCRE